MSIEYQILMHSKSNAFRIELAILCGGSLSFPSSLQVHSEWGLNPWRTRGLYEYRCKRWQLVIWGYFYDHKIETLVYNSLEFMEWCEPTEPLVWRAVWRFAKCWWTLEVDWLGSELLLSNLCWILTYVIPNSNNMTVVFENWH